MAWTAAISTLEAHMTAAGTATAGQFANGSWAVQGGEPGVPSKKLLAWWWEGIGPNPFIAETLTDAPYGDRVTVRAFIPVATRLNTPSRAVEMELRYVMEQLFARLQGDRTLGDNCEALDSPEMDAGWLSIDNGWWRIGTANLILSFTDEVPISR